MVLLSKNLEAINWVTSTNKHNHGSVKNAVTVLLATVLPYQHDTTVAHRPGYVVKNTVDTIDAASLLFGGVVCCRGISRLLSGNSVMSRLVLKNINGNIRAVLCLLQDLL